SYFILVSMLLFSVFVLSVSFILFFFYATATTDIYTLSLHDALPICCSFHPDHRLAQRAAGAAAGRGRGRFDRRGRGAGSGRLLRSEEHTSELQSRENLVCRLLLEKKNKTQ